MGDARFDLQGRRVCVAGHSGMLGSALVRRLVEEDCRLLPLGRETLDLRDQAAVFAWFGEYRPDVVFVAAATVGGIYANDRQPADFLYDNLAIAANVIEAARRSEVRKLVFFGTSCITQRWGRSRLSRIRCSKAHSSRPMNGTAWPKSPESNCAKPIAGNT